MKGYLEIQNLKSRAWKVFDVNEKVCFQFKKKNIIEKCFGLTFT